MHIGLIGGIGPAATEHYYRGLIERHSRSNVPLDLTIVHADVRQLAMNLRALARTRQAEEFARLAQRLWCWRPVCCRHVDGWTFLYQRARSDLTIVAAQRYS